MESWRGLVWADCEELLLIEDSAALAAFIDRIPAKRVQKRRPAPPSTDPLLQRPDLDFEHHILAVAISDHMHAQPVISVVDGQPVMHVPDLGDARHAAAVLGMGSYYAQLVPR